MTRDRRLLAIVLWTLALIGLAGAAHVMLGYWPGSFFLGVKSHVWTALAWDFAHGELYRPPLGPEGYGGTRYMPLLFVVHGSLIRAGFDPIHSGVLLMQATVVAAALALFLALRAAGVAAWLAAPLAATVWCTVLYQDQACTELTPDYLAAAFVMLAGAVAFSPRRAPRLLYASTVVAACLLAVLTKVTAAAFVVPIVAWLWHREQRADALFVVSGTVAGAALAFAFIQYRSSGHFLESLRVTATAGMTMTDAMRAVPDLAWELIQKPLDVLVPCAIAGWCCLKAAKARRLSWAHACFITAAATTVAIFASPGIVANHLVDLQMFSTLVIGASLATGQLHAAVVWPVYGAMAVVLAAISWPLPGIPSVIATLEREGPRSRASLAALHAQFLPAGIPYLSMDPVVPVLSGERPYVVDFFNLELFYKEGAPAGRDVEARVRRRFFAAIVLRDSPAFLRDMDASDPGFDEARRQYWNDRDSPLTRLFRTAYDVRAVRKPFVILAPR